MRSLLGLIAITVILAGCGSNSVVESASGSSASGGTSAARLVDIAVADDARTSILLNTSH